MNGSRSALAGVRAYVFTDRLYGPTRERTREGAQVQHLAGLCAQVTIVGPGIDPVFPVTSDAPAVRLVCRESGREAIYHLEPINAPEGMCGPMFGGAYVMCSDTRVSRLVPFYGAIPLHDRYETTTAAIKLGL